MIRYIRRKDYLANKNNIPSLNHSIINRKFLAYCNWSFVKEKHLKEKEALTLFDNFQKEKSPFYLRIFNEMPRAILEEFINNNSISEVQVKSIHTEFGEQTSFRVKPF